jgi:LL-diaminopimelate aminotransferase
MIKKLMLEKADRLYHLPPVLDEFLPKRERKKMLGREVFDLARFQWLADRQKESYDNDSLPAADDEILGLAEKTAAWYHDRFGVKINPAKETIIGGSIRQILGLFSLAFFNPGDIILIPNPGIWHYRAAAALALAETVPYHLSERNRFKPALNTISGNLARTAKAMIINSPHNPTGAVLAGEELREILRMAGRENLLLIMDQAFEGLIDGNGSVSLYALPGGRKAAMELYSYAYNFGQPLPSVGFAVGQPAIITGLKRVMRTFGYIITKGQIKSGLNACNDPKSGLEEIRRRFAGNRELLDRLCKKMRLIPAEYRSGPFYWAKLPGRRQSRRFCRLLYLRCGILAVPGIAFGENGEGYIRFSLTGRPDTYQMALDATGKLLQASGERKVVNG